MIVHFSSSTQMLTERYELLSKIRGIIIDNGCKLARDWLDEAYNDRNQPQRELRRWKEISQKTISALKQADVVIIEASIDSFTMGYQAALAVQLKKPLLLLREESSVFPLLIQQDSSVRNKNIEETIVVGDKAHGKVIQTYGSEEELRRIIRNFIEENNLDIQDMRFNMFLDRQTYNYLERKSAETGRTKAKIIRDVLREKLEQE